METVELKKVSQCCATEITDRYEKQAEVIALLTEQQTPVELFNLLLERQLYAEANQFLIYALPKREAVWFACVVYQVCKPESRSVMLQLAEQWVYQPDEEHRQPAIQAAEEAGYNTPEGLIAAAVAWSGGSLLPPDAEPVPPAEDLTAKAVWGAILLLAYADKPEAAGEMFKGFLRQAIDIANGGSGRLTQS